MCPGPEGHAGVDFNHDVVGPGIVIAPGGLDHDARADLLRPEERLPGLGPVLLVHLPVADAVDETEVVPHPGDFILQLRAAPVQPFIPRQVADHGVGRRPRHGILRPLFDRLHARVLHHHALQVEVEEHPGNEVCGKPRVGVVEGDSGFDVFHFKNAVLLRISPSGD